MSGQKPGSRFTDYFVVCGLDVEAGLEPDQLSDAYPLVGYESHDRARRRGCTENCRTRNFSFLEAQRGDHLHCNPLNRPYKSHVLAYYPDSLSWNPFDKDAVGMLCLPKGLTFRTQKLEHKPKFHSFIITREDGSRVNGSSFIFYEEVTNEQICAAMQTLHHMHDAEILRSQAHTVLSIQEPLKDHSPLQEQRTLYSETEEDFSYDIRTDTLYVSKCICLVSQMQYVSATRQFLRQLYEAVERPLSWHLPLESYIYNMLFEVPLPPAGRSMKYYGISTPIFCQRPSTSELPLFDFSLWDLVRLLGLDNLILLFISVLLEHQVLLYSSDYQRLMLVAESMNILIFPFSWQHVYVPILPASMQHFLDAPVPYIMGLHRGQEDRSQLELPNEANMCFVDIDSNTVEVPEDLPSFPFEQDLKEELVQAIISSKERMLKETSADSVISSPRRKPTKLSSRSTEPVLSKTNSLSRGIDKLEALQHSEAWTKISALAKKTGVWSNTLDDYTEKSPKIVKEVERADPVFQDFNSMPNRELEELKFNNAVREIFLNRFVNMFCWYDEFVMQTTQDMDSWISNRETMHNFDKASFLSDQPENYLPFLSPFLETQMFATFIDNKILSQWEEIDPNLKVFDIRVKTLRDECDANTHRMDSYTPCSKIRDTELLIEKRSTYIDHVATKPHMPEDTTVEFLAITPGFFPVLVGDIISTEPVSSKPKTKDSAKWRRKDRLLQHSQHLKLNTGQREKYMAEARSKIVHQPKFSDMASGGMAQTNWKFVETLLKECKTKTKRMLVEKMGQEAIELGHSEGNVSGVEENTLIASLCDLLERIWSHGLQTKKGKSALWSHLLNFVEIEEGNNSSHQVDPNLLSPDLSTTAINEAEKTIKRGHRRTGSRGTIELPELKPLPHSLAYDMRKVQEMNAIKTDVGYARAWVRLSLEKKMLSTHLKELLSDSYLLRSLYKRYAFLRCEDEREQFLYHLLSLNAMDYFCFTNSFVNTIVPYRVLIFPSLKFGCSTTSANPWINYAGHMGETGIIEIPKGVLEFSVEHKNLGVLTTMRLGHDNSGLTPKWLVEYVLIRNEISGHTYKFTCGRWLGKGIDDGSIERLLVAELLSKDVDTEEMTVACRTPPRARSPVSPRKNQDQQALTIPDIQEMLGHAVNGLIKHFYRPEKERGNLTFLLCGERGLVNCLENIFLYGFRSSRLFRNKFFIWDYLEKVKTHLESMLEGEVRRPLSESEKAGFWLFCSLFDKINQATESVGKDGKFQIFVCVGIRDHTLQKWLPMIANTTVTAQMYEEKSFLRDRDLITFIIHILDTLNDFDVVLESSLVRGLDI